MTTSSAATIAALQPILDEEQDENRGFTCWFDFDITKFPTNPMHVDTPFGRMLIVGIGNEFARRDRLEEEMDGRHGV